MKNIGYLTFILSIALTSVSCSQEQAAQNSSKRVVKTQLEEVDAQEIKDQLGALLDQKEVVESQNDNTQIAEEVIAINNEIEEIETSQSSDDALLETASVAISNKPTLTESIKKPTKKKKSKSNKEIMASALAQKLVNDENATDTVTTQAAGTKKSSGASSTLTAQLDPSLASGGREGLRGQITLDGYTDFKETESEDKVYYMQSILNVFYDLKNGDNIGLFVPMQKDLYGEFEEKFFLDSRLAYSQNGIIRNENLMFNMRYGVLYPTTENSKVRDEMTFGLELNPTFIVPMSKLLPGLTAVYIPRYRRRFHRFETNRAGEFLVNESLLQIFVLSYQVSPKWDISTTLLHVMSSRYDGARTDDSYLTVQEVGYRMSSNVRARMGIMTGGNIINRQFGDDDTVEIFDENSTEFYTGFAYQF